MIEDKIVALYAKGLGYNEIKKRLGVSPNTISKALILRGVPYRHTIPSAVTKEKEDKVVELYLDGWSGRKIMKHFGMCGKTISQILKNRNIQIRKNKGTGKNRRVFFNEDYFKEIDTEEKAYWLGFWYADGCVARKISKDGTKRGYECFMNLSMKDEDHLLQFAKDIDYPIAHIIYKNRRGRRCPREEAVFLCIYCSSKKMFYALSNNGCVQRKTWLLEFPKFLSRKLMLHLIRGYFDGDGCIHLFKKQRGGASSIIGNQNFIKSLGKYLTQQGLKNQTYQDLQRNYWGVRVCAIGGNKIFYDLIYRNATRFLARKRDKFHILFERNGIPVEDLKELK